MQIVADSVSKVFPGRKGAEDTLALAKVDLQIQPGEFVSLVGPSGCGKSTLLRLVDGLMSPSTGTVTYEGQVITKPSESMAYVFQSAALLPWRTIIQNVTLAGKLRKEMKTGDTQQARDVLKLVGLAGFEDKYPYELSGGMQQRANIARALAVNSKVLLMDEPFGALDAMTRQVMQNELLKIMEASGRTVLFVTHALDEAALLSDRVVVMTRRPGLIKAIVDVPFPRPRDAALRRSVEFQDLCAYMWQMIEEEVKDAI